MPNQDQDVSGLEELEFRISNAQIKLDEMRAEKRSPLDLAKVWANLEELKSDYFSVTGKNWGD